MPKYKDIRELGSGGFGCVHLCERDRDKKQFAKKRLTSSDPEDIKRFQREVRILSKLDHPRIIKVVDKKLSAAPYWYVMPLLDRSLRDCFPDIVGDEPRIATVFVGLLEAIHYAHEEGVIHRDLKPENILVDSNDEVVVTDFGLGRAVNSATTRVTSTGDAFGTFGYIAPEQVRDMKSADDRCDIFSLGQILYELYTGDPPGFRHDLNELPPRIALIVERCTKKNPDDRFREVVEIRNAYESLLGAKASSDSRGRLEEIVASAAATGSINVGEAVELGLIIEQLHEDADLVHEVCIKLPEDAIEVVWNENDGAIRLMVKIFSRQIAEQSWGWSYVDTITDACNRFYRAVPDPSVRAEILVGLFGVGVSHNRGYAMSAIANILEGIDDSTEGLAVANAMRSANVERIERHLTIPKIKDGNIRQLFL